MGIVAELLSVGKTLKSNLSSLWRVFLICLTFIETWTCVFFAAFSIVSEIDGQMERSLHLIA
jgi:hypothetical protein